MRPKPGCFEVKRRRNGGGSAGIGLKKRLISQLKTELSEPSPDDSCDEVISLRYVSLFTEWTRPSGPKERSKTIVSSRVVLLLGIYLHESRRWTSSSCHQQTINVWACSRMSSPMQPPKNSDCSMFIIIFPIEIAGLLVKTRFRGRVRRGFLPKHWRSQPLRPCCPLPPPPLLLSFPSPPQHLRNENAGAKPLRDFKEITMPG